jgi:hypothetical protein
MQHYFKIVLYWCLDLIRHNIGTPLKHNKYIFDIPIPFCHYPYPSKSLTNQIACRNLLRPSHVNGIAKQAMETMISLGYIVSHYKI